MSDGELLCNYKKCRKALTGTAYITRCSHAFCEGDGLKQIESQHFDKKCPACDSPLVNNYDLVKVTLNPSDQFKSMVLAGLRPEVIMDVATRAIMFWNYQQHQEHLHQMMVSKSLKDFIGQMKSDTEVETGILKSEIQNLKRKQEDLEKEIKRQTQKSNELSEKVAQKTREIQKWQMLHESLKRKQLSAAMLHQHETNNFDRNPMALNMGPQVVDDLLTARAKTSHGDHPTKEVLPAGHVPRNVRSPPLRRDPDHDDGFVFQPRALNTSLSPRVFLDNPANYGVQARRKYQR